MRSRICIAFLTRISPTPGKLPQSPPNPGSAERDDGLHVVPAHCGSGAEPHPRVRRSLVEHHTLASDVPGQPVGRAVELHDVRLAPEDVPQPRTDLEAAPELDAQDPDVNV